MRRLERVRVALEQLNFPSTPEVTAPQFHPHICTCVLKELVECLYFVFFPEYTHPPSCVTPMYAQADSLMEWVIAHIAEILTSQVCFAFVLHGDPQAVESTTVFAPVDTLNRKQLHWTGSPWSNTSSGATEDSSPNKKGTAAAGPGPLSANFDSFNQRSSDVKDAVSVMSTTDSGLPPQAAAKTPHRANDAFLSNCKRKAYAIVTKFLVERLAHIRWLLQTDVEALFKGDVAASSPSEVVLCYPGIRCMVHQRVAHQLHLLGVPLNFTRMLTEMAHSVTGVDIHPSTTIGHHFFIDHGTGIVIGATAVIGNHVSIYQGVTLGARSFQTDKKTGELIRGLPRHPIIEDGVTIYANAVVLGRVTIGEHSTIGGNCWVVRSVPPFSSVVQKSNRVLHQNESMFLEKDGSGI